MYLYKHLYIRNTFLDVTSGRLFFLEDLKLRMHWLQFSFHIYIYICCTHKSKYSYIYIYIPHIYIH